MTAPPLMTGTPPTGDDLVTLANWQDPPFNRWGFSHVRELIPTARIRPAAAPWPLARRERDLTRERIRGGGREWTFGELLDASFTDGVLVHQGGGVVYEDYRGALTPDTPHLLMSVSKSITSTAVGCLVAEGRLDPSDAVTAVLPELAGTSFEGATVRHLLDMRAGTRFDEDYANLDADVRRYEQVFLWRPRTDPGLPDDACAYYATLANDGPHGGPFRYRSILTDVLGWVAERAAGMRFAELVSTRVWQPIGAEFAAEVTVDGHGNAMADGGVCATLRDLARFGLIMLAGGRRDAEQVVPAAWMEDVLTPDADSRATFAAGEDVYDFPFGAYYRDKWWVIDADHGVFAGLGINGQMVLVDREHDGVVAKLSTWPEASSEEYFRPTLEGCRDLLRRLAGG